jgi:hypothetical protein
MIHQPQVQLVLVDTLPNTLLSTQVIRASQDGPFQKLEELKLVIRSLTEIKRSILVQLSEINLHLKTRKALIVISAQVTESMQLNKEPSKISCREESQ